MKVSGPGAFKAAGEGELEGPAGLGRGDAGVVAFGAEAQPASKSTARHAAPRRIRDPDRRGGLTGAVFVNLEPAYRP
ncbi:MAG TPA: hypothetical protein VIP52_03980 [Candidatus Dormibacteraeota bacterium]